VRAHGQLAPSALWVLRICAFALVGSFYFLRLGAGALWDNSETTYGEIIKELFRTGDWLTLHFNYSPWLIHPPLWFWITAGSVKLFGLNEFALRLPSATFGLACALAVYAAGRRMYGEIAGLVAVLAAAGNLEWIMLSRIAILDTLLVLCITVATFWIYFAVKDHDRPAFWLAAIAAALGTLTKGPVALVLPLTVLGCYAAWKAVLREPAGFSRLGWTWLWGALAYVVIAGSWFWAETARNGIGFLTYYFGVSNIGRYLSPFENQPGPWWYYIPVVVAGFFPYIAFVPKAFATAWRAREDDARYLILCALVPFLFFSFAQTKLPNYIAVMFPSLGILVGRVFRDALQTDNVRALRGALVTLTVSLLLLAVIIVFYGKTQLAGPFLALQPALALLGWFVIPPAVLTFALTYVTNRVWIAPAGLAVMMAGFMYASIFSILPRAEAFKPMKSMARIVNSYYRPGDKIGVTGISGGISLLFYTDGRGVTWVGDAPYDARPKEFFDQRARVLCVARPAEVGAFERAGVKLWVLTQMPSLWLVSNRPG
jgi:4-amino-4-deoxy-L-arabinose transferase-like glycosyltransferase